MDKNELRGWLLFIVSLHFVLISYHVTDHFDRGLTLIAAIVNLAAAMLHHLIASLRERKNAIRD